jgi:hypothetical protein
MEAESDNLLHLAINRQTAKVLDLGVQATLLRGADEVIE